MNRVPFGKFNRVKGIYVSAGHSSNPFKYYQLTSKAKLYHLQSRWVLKLQSEKPIIKRKRYGPRQDGYRQDNTDSTQALMN